MKNFAVAALALSLGASTALAGGLEPPVMEMAPVEIVEDTTQAGSSGGLIVPLIIVALIAAAISANSSSD